MFVAGGLIAANFRLTRGLSDANGDYEIRSMYGFPLRFQRIYYSSGFEYSQPTFVPTTKVLADVVVFVFVIATSAFFCEWLIRRREGKP